MSEEDKDPQIQYHIDKFFEDLAKSNNRAYERKLRDEKTRKMLDEDPLTVFGIKRKGCPFCNNIHSATFNCQEEIVLGKHEKAP